MASIFPIEAAISFGRSFRFGQLEYPAPVIGVCNDGSLILWDEENYTMLLMPSPANEILQSSLIRNG